MTSMKLISISQPDNESKLDLFIIVISVLYFVYELFLISHYHQLFINIEYDGYFLKAEEVLKGRIVNNGWHPPLYYIVSAIPLYFLENSLYACKIVTAMAGSVFLCLTYFIGKKLFNYTIGIAATVLTMFNPFFATNFITANSDGLFSALSLGCVLWFIYFIQNTNQLTYKRAILCGGFIGATYLTRFQGLFLLPMFFLLINLKDKESIIRSLKWLTILTLSFVITIIPWNVYTYTIYGNFSGKNSVHLAFKLFGKGNYNNIKGLMELTNFQVLFSYPILFFKSFFDSLYLFHHKKPCPLGKVRVLGYAIRTTHVTPK